MTHKPWYDDNESLRTGGPFSLNSLGRTHCGGLHTKKSLHDILFKRDIPLSS